MNVERGALVAANWKNANMTIGAAEAWSDGFNSLAKNFPQRKNLELVLFAPFSAAFRTRQKLLELEHTRSMIEQGMLAFGGQDVDPDEGEKWRFTGSTHPRLFLDPKLDLKWFLVGHSERRIHSGESNETIAKKMALGLKYGLKPILCVGETLEEYEKKRTEEVVAEQLSILDGVAPEIRRGMTVAYEPVWAIGTGKTPSFKEANDLCAFVRKKSKAKRVIYGGSVTKENAAEFFAQSDIDGALPGGASEKADQFFGIASAASDRL